MLVPRVLRDRPQHVVDEDNMAVRPMQFTDVDLGKYRAEYGFKNGDVILHFFKVGGGSFPMSFRSRLYNSLQNWGELKIDWVEELQSWCVIVKGGAVTPPHQNEIVDALRSIVGQ